MSGNIETDDDDEKIIDDGSEETIRVPHHVYKKNCNELICSSDRGIPSSD